MNRRPSARTDVRAAAMTRLSSCRTRRRDLPFRLLPQGRSRTTLPNAYETGECVDLKFTSLPCDNELFQVFSDFRIELTARGYYVAPIDEGAIDVRPEDVDDGALAKKPAQGGLQLNRDPD